MCWVALVAHTGFEPVISALRGRCPGPLDECATQEERPSGLGPTASIPEAPPAPHTLTPEPRIIHA